MTSLIVALTLAQLSTPDLHLVREVSMAQGAAAMAKRDFATARSAFEAAVAINPNDGYAAFQLGSALLSTAQDDPEAIRTGCFYYARAAHLMGNDQIKSWVKRQHTLIYKTPLGLVEYWEFVRKTPLAPPTIEGYPPAPLVPLDDDMFYDLVRAELLGPNGQVFFEDVLRGNRIQGFRGKLVSYSPELNPRELVLTMREPGDLRLFVNPPLRGKADPGIMITIDEATVKSYSKKPYRIDMDLPPDAMRGWPVRPGPTLDKP